MLKKVASGIWDIIATYFYSVEILKYLDFSVTINTNHWSILLRILCRLNFKYHNSNSSALFLNHASVFLFGLVQELCKTVTELTVFHDALSWKHSCPPRHTSCWNPRCCLAQGAWQSHCPDRKDGHLNCTDFTLKSQIVPEHNYFCELYLILEYLRFLA